MAEYSNDEERLLAIVDFFKHYRNLILSIVISISVIGIGAYGIKYTQDAQNSSAALVYSTWIEDISNEENSIINDNESFDILINEYESTGFAQLAMLKKASALASNSQLGESKIFFKKLIDTSGGFFGNPLVNKMSRVSLARILIAESNYGEALNSIEGLMTGSDPLVNELAGDALVGQKKNTLAIEQYNLARDLYDDDASKNIIIMKLNNIQQVL
jgi:predicted negative regulator of RcsB-dependent stress response|tara:strand:- start:1856 stop:2503 length:648 start_codon:yes stop_codon:yes gene_type:complete